jgi:hypothetical protein
MKLNIAEEVKALKSMTVGELRERLCVPKTRYR